MTIAAGFRCTDGVALCTDSEYTDGGAKNYGKKIYSVRPRNGFVYLAGAGDVSLISGIRDALEKKIGDKDATIADLKKHAGDIVNTVYKRHIVKPRQLDPNFPGVDILLAARFDRGAELYRVGETGNISEPSSTPECVGMDTGKAVIGALAEVWFSANDTSIYAMPAIAKHIIIAAVENATYCGGAAQIVCLSDDGDRWESIAPSQYPGNSPLADMLTPLPNIVNFCFRASEDDETLESLLSAMNDIIRGVRDNKRKKSRNKLIEDSHKKWVW